MIKKQLKIDKRIKEVVCALNKLDVSTTGSCEGHINRGSPAPWIKITSANATADKKLYQIVSELLAEFYKNRKIPADIRIVVTKTKTGFWLHNNFRGFVRWRKDVNKRVLERKKGKKIKEIISVQEKTNRGKTLPLYQKEMKAFAEFLTSPSFPE